MKIITGTFKGRKIPVVKSWTGRPTTGKAKEGLFSYLQAHFTIKDKRVMDIFTGTGSIALEFCSHGAKTVVSIDNFLPTIKQITQTTDLWQVSNLKTIHADALKLLSNKPEKPFDIIFADPPFNWNKKHQLIEYVFKNKWLAADGVFILEHSKDDQFKDHKHLLDVRNYSNIQFLVFN